MLLEAPDSKLYPRAHTLHSPSEDTPKSRTYKGEPARRQTPEPQHHQSNPSARPDPTHPTTSKRNPHADSPAPMIAAQRRP
jgi:hypothetical protein